MDYHFCWGVTFLAIETEFWPWQVIEIRACADQAIRETQTSRKLALVGVKVSRLVFDAYGYGFVLIQSGSEWTLEVAEFPPHAEPGQRVRAARRKREREERNRSKHSNLRATLAFVQLRAVEILSKTYHFLNSLRRKLNALLRQAEPAGVALGLTVREELMRMTDPSRELCRSARVAAWFDGATAPCEGGARREWRLFCADIGLPMWLQTLSPIEAAFVLGGVSIFGERVLESEWVT